MKKPKLSNCLLGILALGCAQAGAQTVLTANNLQLRKDATFIYPSAAPVGGASVGEIVVRPGFDPLAVANTSPMDLQLRWQGLDLDGVGGNDDYFDFNVRVTSNVQSVYFTSLGFGVTPTWGLDSGEAVTYQIVNVTLKGGIPGAVSFDGFSEAGLLVTADAGAGNPTTASMSGDINGNPVSVDIVSGTGFQSSVAFASFPLTSSVVFDNFVKTDGSATPNGWARECDLQFTYDENAPPPPVTVSSTGTSIRSNGVFPNTGALGGASTGGIIPNPDATFPPTAGPVTNYPLRWTGLDLDNDGSADDYFNFSVRVTNIKAGSSDNVVISNQGIGVNGGGSGELDTGDEVRVEIADMQVSPGIPGSVSFDGFKAATLGAGVAANSGTVNVGCNINGIPVFIDLPNNAAFQYKTSKATFPSLISTVVFDNVVETEDIGKPSGRVRELDMQFTYDASIAPPPTVLTATALDLRPDATYIRPTGTEPFNQGGTNKGDLVTPAGFDPTATTAAPPMDFPRRWTYLDVDNDGLADDYIDFKLRASSGSDTDVSFGAEGMGVGGYMDPGEQLTFEVVDIVLSPGTPGQVTFDGFFGGTFSGIGNAGAGLSTTGSIQADINGNTVSVDLNGTGYTNVSQSATFAPVASLLFDNIISTPGTVTPTGRVRNYSLQFSYSQVATVSGFTSWKSANGATGEASDDHDSDGVSNGVEHFLGGTGNTTGFTALPGVVTAGSVRSVTWTKAGTYSGTYGDDFVVETSTTLAAGSWTTETLGGSVVITENEVKYTFPAGPVKSFVRLRVITN